MSKRTDLRQMEFILMPNEYSAVSCTLTVCLRGAVIGRYLACPAYSGPTPYHEEWTEEEAQAVAAAFSWCRRMPSDAILPARALPDVVGGAVVLNGVVLATP